MKICLYYFINFLSVYNMTGLLALYIGVVQNVDFSSDVAVGKKQFSVGLTVVNLLNQTYRDYMNRFRYFNDEPGRSINLRIKLKL